MNKTIKYFFDEDVAYIQLNENSSPVGDEEFQDNVILYRNNGELSGIEIISFSAFKENKIKISDDKSLDFSTAFEKIRMFRSLKDIMHTDRDQFESTLREWGFEKVEEKQPDNITLNVLESEFCDS